MFAPGSSLPSALIFLVAALSFADTLEETLAQAHKLRRSGRATEAVELLEAARSAHADQEAPGDLAGLDGLLGALLLDLGQVGRARTLAAGLAHHDGSNYRALVFLGRFAAEEDGDLDGALQSYRQAARLEARPLDALQGQIAVFLERRQFGKAAKRAEAIAEFDKETGSRLLGDIYLAQADVLRNGGAEMLPLAISRYRMALQQRPTDLDIVRKLLEVLLLTLHFDEALDLNAAAFASEAQRGELLLWNGRIHESAKDINAARNAFRESYSLQPENGLACLHLARLALSDGQADTAREWLDRAIDVMGESPRSLVLLAEVHNGLGDAEAALSCLTRAVASQPGNAGAHYQRARTLLRLGRRKEGAAAMERFRSIKKAAQPAIDDNESRGND